MSLNFNSPRHAFLAESKKNAPKEKEIHLILDNYSSHKTAKVKRWLQRRPHWHHHSVPTHSSWLNQVERFFGKITMDIIRRGVFRSVPELKKRSPTI